MGRLLLSSKANPDLLDERTIVLAPTGRDGHIIATLLERMSMPCHAVATMKEACDEIRKGAGAAIIAEEALVNGSMEHLMEVLGEQPTWSDFPVLLLTVSGRVTAENQRLRALRRPLGNVLLLERPIRPETLLSTLEIALRARKRQYQIRDHIHQYSLAQEALRRSEKLAVTGRLAASIAHEINNPLESVTNLLYLIRSETTSPQVAAYLDQADQELARVTEITTQTLRFYREPNHPVRTEVAAVLRSVLVLYHSRLVAANIRVEQEILAPSVTVMSSPGELRQIIANIIGNAIDAMRRGGTLRIRLSIQSDAKRPGNRHIRLSIGDTGSGIAPELLPTIFEPFITSKGETGTGLGLWVTSEILKKNGWTMRVRSRNKGPASGTVFSLRIPVLSSERLAASA